MLNEAREYLSDGRVRPDHYRGLTKAQITGVYAENEAVEKYRKEMNENQFDEGAQFRAESDHVNVLVAAAEYHAQNEKLRERLDVQEHLQKMIIEERERKGYKEGSPAPSKKVACCRAGKSPGRTAVRDRGTAPP